MSEFYPDVQIYFDDNILTHCDSCGFDLLGAYRLSIGKVQVWLCGECVDTVEAECRDALHAR